MRSIIILKGLVKSDKIKWVKEQGLDDFYIELDTIRKLYASPELVYPGKGTLIKTFTDTVYKKFIEVICARMGKGCLIIADMDSECANILETLALIFGYTVFYKVFDVPQDYVTKHKKYATPYYMPKRKPELEKEVSMFLNIPLTDRLLINTYQDVLDYWKRDEKNYTFKIKKSDKILYVSDLHSNYKTFLKLPKNKYRLTIYHGDYIDGPEINGSRKLMDFLLRDDSSNIIWLEGNHELRLRRYLGGIILRSMDKDLMAEIVLGSLNQTFLNTTALEFNDLTPIEAREYLKGMNEKLKMYCIINSPDTQYISTHAGIKYKETLDPKYIGSVLYGNRDMNRFDKAASEICVKQNFWSIHAHCKYPDSWEVMRFDNIVNLDPIDETQVIFAELKNNNWKIWKIIND